MSESRRPVSSGSGAPPPRRPGAKPSSSPPSTAPPGPPPTPTAATPAAVPIPAPAPAKVVVEPSAEAVAPARSGRSKSAERDGARSGRLPLPLRLLAWLVAIPLGLALVGIPARKAGYLTGQKLLDVVIGSDLNRFVPLLVIVLLWALVTAVLVQLFAEGGGWLLRRRRARKAGSAV